MSLTHQFRAIKDVQSFNYNIEGSLKNAEERVDQSITAIKVSVRVLSAYNTKLFNTYLGVSSLVGGGQRKASPRTLRNCRYCS
jgi:hypothetical protein